MLLRKYIIMKDIKVKYLLLHFKLFSEKIILGNVYLNYIS